MRKVILFVNASLDGYMGGEGGDMSWMVDDEEMDDDFTVAIRERADTILTGRVLYESFEGAWPAGPPIRRGFRPRSPSSPGGWSRRRWWCSPTANPG